MNGFQSRKVKVKLVIKPKAIPGDQLQVFDTSPKGSDPRANPKMVPRISGGIWETVAMGSEAVVCVVRRGCIRGVLQVQLPEPWGHEDAEGGDTPPHLSRSMSSPWQRSGVDAAVRRHKAHTPRRQLCVFRSSTPIFFLFRTNWKTAAHISSGTWRMGSLI